MELRHLLAAGCVAFVAIGAQARAATYDLSYTTTGGDSFTGVITTTGTATYTYNQLNTQAQQDGGVGFYQLPTDVVGYTIESITGTLNGAATTIYGTSGAAQLVNTPGGAPGGTYVFDNVIYVGTNPSSPYVDLAGLEFTTDVNGNSAFYNVYSTAVGGVYYENLTPINGLSLTYDPSGNHGVSPVPLPAALPLFGAAAAGFGGFGWFRKRRRSA